MLYSITDHDKKSGQRRSLPADGNAQWASPVGFRELSRSSPRSVAAQGGSLAGVRPGLPVTPLGFGESSRSAVDLDLVMLGAVSRLRDHVLGCFLYVGD